MSVVDDSFLVRERLQRWVPAAALLVLLLVLLPAGSRQAIRTCPPLPVPVVAKTLVSRAAVEPHVVYYVLDSGMRATHERLRGHVEYAHTILPNPHVGSEQPDIPDHGTMVASLLLLSHPPLHSRHGGGGNANKTIVSVRVVGANGLGVEAAILEAISFAAEYHARRHATALGIIVSCVTPSPSPSSVLPPPLFTSRLRLAFFRWWHNPAMHLARAREGNMVVVLAAGNYNTDACSRFRTYFPCAETDGNTGLNTLVVGALDEQDPGARALYSNFGPCVNVFARGQATGASSQSDTATRTMVGTSVSAPVAAGAFGSFWMAHHSAFPSAAGAVAAFLACSELVNPHGLVDLRCAALPAQQESCANTTTRTLLLVLQ